MSAMASQITSLTIPLYKADYPMKFNNYRPVSLLNIVSKIFEKAMYDRLTYFLETMASQISGVSIVCSTVYSGADQRIDQSSASLSFVGGIHR